MKTDNSLLQAALFGYQSQIAEMEKAMAEIQRKLGGSSAGTLATATKTGRRKLSAAARKRISTAQKKRWAEFKKQKGQS